MKVAAVSPTKGRAMTRPTRSGWTISAAMRQTLVEPIEAEVRLVRGDLQHAVGRGVEDRLAGADVLLAEVVQHRHARRMGVAEGAAAGRRARSAAR